ncbi:Extracellular dioxygenase protein [Rutstroemia sp. NJR-2017a WRK4]|nr:Extracellular dioxygenase protein [Rutstroemia sp. NJR-2017a WRK4]
MHFTAPLIAAAAFLSSVSAHPGHDHSAEIAQRSAYLEHSKRDLSHCAAKIKARGLAARNVQRRAATVNQLRTKRSLSARDEATVLNTTHLSSIDYSPSDAETTVFSSNNSCVLSPEVTQGPYYVSGEYYRYNNTEDQVGVPLILDTQVLDIDTCEPVDYAMLEIWNCNSTGVYSGIVTNGNGDSSDTSNINATFLRSIQSTDADGVAQFATIVPGHYTSRTNHIHVLVHLNATVLANSTISGGTVAHVGQIFFDQDLITQVEATAPYNTNTQDVTLNADDSVLSSEAASSDPVIEYSLLGDSIEDGIFGWLAFGIDVSNSFTITPAAEYTSSGGVENDSGSSSGGGSGGPGGAPPSKN